MGDRMGQALPPGWTWTPCPKCQHPILEHDTFSAHGGRVRHGCAGCLFPAVADARMLLVRAHSLFTVPGGFSSELVKNIEAFLVRTKPGSPSEGEGDSNA